MVWGFIGGAATVVGAVATWASLGRARFERRFAEEARALLGAASPLPPGSPELDPEARDRLPPPVREYSSRVLAGSTPRGESVRFRHGGSFRTKLDGKFQPIRGEQYDTSDPPAFLWRGRLSPMPGVWIDARDRFIGGKGNMRVALQSSITLFDRVGPELDQGAALRLLSDLVLLPRVLLDERYVSWTPVDDRRARASLRVEATVVSGVFEFGDDGLPRTFSAERYLDTGAGQPRLLPWSGDYADYRRVDGLLVPHHFVGYWHVDGRRIPYADFVVDTLEYDVREPFS